MLVGVLVHSSAMRLNEVRGRLDPPIREDDALPASGALDDPLVSHRTLNGFRQLLGGHARNIKNTCREFRSAQHLTKVLLA